MIVKQCVITNSVFNCVHSNYWLLLVVMVLPYFCHLSPFSLPLLFLSLLLSSPPHPLPFPILPPFFTLHFSPSLPLPILPPFFTLHFSLLLPFSFPSLSLLFPSLQPDSSVVTFWDALRRATRMRDMFSLQFCPPLDIPLLDITEPRGGTMVCVCVCVWVGGWMGE